MTSLDPIRYDLRVNSGLAVTHNGRVDWNIHFTKLSSVIQMASSLILRSQRQGLKVGPRSLPDESRSRVLLDLNEVGKQ